MQNPAIQCIVAFFNTLTMGTGFPRVPPRNDPCFLWFFCEGTKLAERRGCGHIAKSRQQQCRVRGARAQDGATENHEGRS